MSARALRRTFATPFVLTLATVPAACIATSNPPPPSSPQQQANHEHGDGHVNPPKPKQAPEPAEWHTSPSGTNDHVKGTASTSSTTVEQAPVAQTAPSPTSQARGYRQWTVTRSGATCSSMVKVNCPEGAMCNPPPPAQYECPKALAENGRIDIIQHAEKGDCFVDFGEPTCPPNTKCNPPRPQKVACPK